MKKLFFLFLLFLNIFYIAHALFDFGERISVVWNVLLGLLFITSLIYSAIHLFQSKKYPLLSVAVLSFSLASLGWFAFINFLSFVIG